MLFFEGASSVMGFFDFLYNNMLQALTTTSADVPLLLAPVPFINATLHQLELKARTAFDRALLDESHNILSQRTQACLIVRQTA